MLVLSWEYPPHLIGGLGRHVYELTRHLARRGVTVDVLTGGRPGDPDNAELDGVRVHRVPLVEAEGRPFPIQVSLTNLNLLREAVRLARGPGPPFDLLHAHDWLVAFAARLLKHAYHLPLLATIHATEHGRNRGIHTQLQKHIHDSEWLLAYEAWRVICCSQAMCAELAQVLAVPRDKLEVIPNGVGCPPERSAGEVAEARLRYAAPGEPLVVYVAAGRGAHGRRPGLRGGRPAPRRRRPGNHAPLGMRAARQRQTSQG